MGAMDNGIVSPAREIIQNGFGIATFGIGSLLCGLSSFTNNFTYFLIARVIQAIGAGGIISIATNVISQSFPKEKEGMALGLVGAMYGIATILGPTIGSIVLNIATNVNWFWLFFINVPISLAIILLSYKIPKFELNSEKKPIDYIGAVLFALVIGNLMYALTNINFFEFITSIQTIGVYPHLLAFVVFLPILIMVENKALDPMINIKYFRSRKMVTIFLLSFVVGIGMMGMIFVPQFAENVLRIKSGTGGYVVTLLALFSGIAAPLSGNLIDKKGAKFVMIIGFLFNILGTLSMAFLATRYLNFISLVPGLIFMGFGIGFTIGAPLNYLILRSVPKEEGATALATMSLMRSIGVAISPSIMIGFIINATKNLQGNLMNVISIPQGTDLTTNSNAFSKLANSDVTTIVDKIKEVISSLVPSFVQQDILNAIETSRNIIERTFQSTINSGYTNIYIASAIIATIGLIITLLLKNKEEISV